MSKKFKDFEYDIQYNYADYRTKEGKRDYAVVFKYLGSDTKVVIPSEIESYPVISMVDTFTNREEMEEIILPNSLENISYGCFRNCKNIKTFEIPKTLQKIGTEAFSGCTSLEEIILPQDDEFSEHMAENGLKSRDNILFSSLKSLMSNADEKINDSELIGEVLKIYGNGLDESTIKFLNDTTTADKWTHSLALGDRDLGQNIFENCTKLI
ncbi:MAG: leucine-rich repeat domain-containing protein, partial [Eubacteriales bacterium]